jgi:hypothetical protein
MKTKCIKLDRIIPWVGIALIGGGIMAAVSYLDLERSNQAAQASMATFNRLIQEQQLSGVLKKLHDGQVDEAAKALDLLLCGDILLTNAELPSVNAETRAAVQDTFRRIAVVRPRTEGPDAALGGNHLNDRVAAERILSLAQAAPHNIAVK